MRSARRLPLDPIEFRRRNALQAGWRTMAGNPYIVSVRTPEILDKLEKHPIWQRARRGEGAGASGNSRRNRRRLRHQGLRHRSGLLAGRRSKSIRTARSPSTATPSRWATASGRRSPIGSQPSSARVADEVAVAQVDAFGPLGLVTSGDPYTISQENQDAAARNPRWVPAISSATSASTGAHVGTHAAAEAARVIFRFGLWPAALELWGIAPTDPRAKEWERARWRDGQLVMPGLRRFPCRRSRQRRMRAMASPAAMAHGFNRWAWSQATFSVDGQPWTADIDALAVRRAGGKFVRLDRTYVKFPPTDFNRIGPSYSVGVRHGGPHRDRARDRRAADRKSLQRAGMRPGVGARDRARTGARRLRHGRRLCAARDAAALRGWARQREMEPRPIPRRARLGPAAP